MHGPKGIWSGLKRLGHKGEKLYATAPQFFTRDCFHDQGRRYSQLGTSLFTVVHAVRPGVLRYRTDANGRAEGGCGSLWLCPSRDAAPIGPHDCGGHAYLQDGEADEASI